jgi:hypothetical protein
VIELQVATTIVITAIKTFLFAFNHCCGGGGGIEVSRDRRFISAPGIVGTMIE